jgi:OmpA-OmpF porin, OOP family
MNKISNKKQISLAVSCVLALGILSGVASAQTKAEDTGYLTDTRGAVVRSGYGLCWHTGFGPKTNMPECDPAPVKVADATPPPPPAPTPAASPKPAGGKVTLDADTLFDFDKAVLRPAGKQALDEFLEKMKDINPEVIIAVGFADRFGSSAYNQNLSERRATSVKTYIMSKGIDANRIHTEGKGKTQPVTKPDDCKGAKSAKVIACLQPDRRVEIEVVGTQIVK